MDIMQILGIFNTQSYVDINLGSTKVKAKLDRKNFEHAIVYDQDQILIAKFDFLIIGWLIQVFNLMIKEKENSIGNINIKTFLARQTFMNVVTGTGKVELRLDDESYIEALEKGDYFAVSIYDVLIIGAYLNLFIQII